MAVFKCKMCGGDLEIAKEVKVAECEYCGTKQTVPTAKDENLHPLFNRANTLRIKGEFDKAEKIYEKIISADETQAEAYWGLILCKYGIEYVEDPATFKRVPTCHRASFDSIVADDDYKTALKYADGVQRGVYEAEAVEIDRIQKEILALSQKEEPYDVFICYKETDETGRRTQDSVIANDIYHQLTQEGFKVFYAAITLEDKLGSAYEPCIFAALNSAKVMLAIGTKPEYFNAVWVKNEWSRYLKLMKNDRSRILIPCYRDMDAYELPEEFSHLQAQDMSKIGFINDVVRGIKKVIVKDEPVAIKTKTVITESAIGNVAPLLERAFMFLEDGDFSSAEEYCEKVLDIDPKCAEAYLGKLMAILKVRKKDDLKNCAEPFDKNSNYQKTIRFGDDTLKKELAGYIEYIITRNKNARLEAIYTDATAEMNIAKTEDDYKKAATIFKSISTYKDSEKLVADCLEKAEIARKDNILDKAKELMKSKIIDRIEESLNLLESISGWKDADELVGNCREKYNKMKESQAEAIAAEKKRKKMEKKITIITTPIVCVAIAFVILLNTLIIPTVKYNNAVSLIAEGKYTEAIAEFQALDGFKDSAEKIQECNQGAIVEKYNIALELMNEGKYTESIAVFNALNDYKDSTEKIKECKYNYAVLLLNEGKNEEALNLFNEIVEYKDARQYLINNLKPFIKSSKLTDSGESHTVGLNSDGTVIAIGKNNNGQCDVSDWTNIIAVSADASHTIGLKSNGTVIATGDNHYGQCDVSDWSDIIDISTSGFHTVGLKSDGTVVATGNYFYGMCNVSGWADIIAVSAGSDYTIGLKSDGTVIATGNDYDGQCNVSNWTDIIAVSSGFDHTIGLKSDGTVVATGRNDEGQCNVSDWTDIIAISAGFQYTIGIKSDGTVVATGENNYGRCNISGWTDIIAISTDFYGTVGIKSDGTVVATGANDKGQYNVSEWNLF